MSHYIHTAYHRSPQNYTFAISGNDVVLREIFSVFHRTMADWEEKTQYVVEDGSFRGWSKSACNLLQVACERDHPGCAAVIMEEGGADPNWRQDGKFTALTLAAKSGRKEVVEVSHYILVMVSLSWSRDYAFNPQ